LGFCKVTPEFDHLAAWRGVAPIVIGQGSAISLPFSAQSSLIITFAMKAHALGHQILVTWHSE
jgi:hypothetical protein